MQRVMRGPPYLHHVFPGPPTMHQLHLPPACPGSPFGGSEVPGWTKDRGWLVKDLVLLIPLVSCVMQPSSRGNLNYFLNSFGTVRWCFWQNCRSSSTTARPGTVRPCAMRHRDVDDRSPTDAASSRTDPATSSNGLHSAGNVVGLAIGSPQPSIVHNATIRKAHRLPIPLWTHPAQPRHRPRSWQSLSGPRSG